MDWIVINTFAHAVSGMVSVGLNAVAFVKANALDGVDLDLDTDRPYERHNWVVAHLKELKDRVHHDDKD